MAATRLLVIDDQEEVRETLRDMLEANGYEVLEAADGKKGLRLLKRQELKQPKTKPVDVVITDMIMPEKEGVETILELRRKYPGIKIVAISGGGPDYLRMAKVLGADRILAKPFSPEELLDAVRKVLEDES